MLEVIMIGKNPSTEKREKLRGDYWLGEEAWLELGIRKEKGWFAAPRTLPLILQLIDSKQVSGKSKPSSVYLDLLARHIDSGIVEIMNESECAFSAGYSGSRAVRTWQERMKILIENGFIKAVKIGNQPYRYVLLVHPTIAVKQLYDAKKVSVHWWDTYRARQREAKETTYEERQAAKAPTNVLPLNRPKVVPAKATQKKKQSA
jgi:hypothetical protein